MTKIFKGKRILVTGSCGTIGKELIRQLITNKKYSFKEIVGLDSNENGIFFLDQKYLKYSNINFIVSDVRQLDELINNFKGIDIVFHTAALKHVILSERSPEQVVETNINGVQNVIKAANINNVKKVIFTSSDKAVNPTNVMGASKLMGERLITAANNSRYGKGPIFTSTRFGNVLGSNGSVTTIFQNQIINGEPITLTDKSMTRFVMSIEEAAHLLIDSSIKAKGGEVFITKMPVIRISDLSKAMIEILAPKYGIHINKIQIIEIGKKPGEKYYEELMNNEEINRAIELKNYFSILPAFNGTYDKIDYDYKDIVKSKVNKVYNSNKEPFLSVDKIKKILLNNNVLKIHQKTVNHYSPIKINKKL
jgi:FlaA1/EpsC-like NDP-sugar epimerase